MSHKINLLTKQKKYGEIEKTVSKVKAGFIVLASLLFVLIFILGVITLLQKRKLNSLYNEKRSLLEYSVAHKDEEAEFLFLKSKQKQLATIVRNDPDYARYYNTLKDSIRVANVDGTLDSFTLDKKRETAFTLKIKELASTLSFVQFADSDEFLRHFESLSLGGFVINRDKEEDFSLQFIGTFKL